MAADGSSHAPDGEYLQLFTATHCTVSKSAALHHDTPLDLSNKDFRLHTVNWRSPLYFPREREREKKFAKSCPLVFQDATLLPGQETHKLRKEAKL